MKIDIRECKKIENLFYISLALLFITPVLPQILKVVVIALFTCISILSYLQNDNSFKWKFFIVNSSVYTAYLISLFYTKNLDYAMSKLEVSASIMLFPLCFALIPNKLLKMSIKKIKIFFKAFILSVLVLNLFLTFSFWYLGNGDFFSGNYIRYVNSLNDSYLIHSLYLSIHNCIALIMLIYILKTERFLKTGIYLFIIGLLIAMSLLLLLKKGPIIAFFIASTFLSLKYQLKRIWAFYLLLTISFSVFFLVNPNIMLTFNQLFKIENIQTTKGSLQIQESVLNCAKENIQKAGYFGLGVGDAKMEQIKCYETTDMDLAISSFNTHNQYVGLIHMIGFFGLFVYLVFIAYNLFNAVKSEAYVNIALILFFSIVMFSENILERQEGVVYFSLLINWLFFFKSNTELS